MNRLPVFDRALIPVLFASALLTTSPASRADNYPEPLLNSIQVPKSTLTRAEVLAELQIWRESGLDRFEHPEVDAARDEAGQAAAQARYAALRQGPRFAQLVAQYAAKNTPRG